MQAVQQAQAATSERPQICRYLDLTGPLCPNNATSETTSSCMLTEERRCRLQVQYSPASGTPGAESAWGDVQTAEDLFQAAAASDPYANHGPGSPRSSAGASGRAGAAGGAGASAPGQALKPIRPPPASGPTGGLDRGPDAQEAGGEGRFSTAKWREARPALWASFTDVHIEGA